MHYCCCLPACRHPVAPPAPACQVAEEADALRAGMDRFGHRQQRRHVEEAQVGPRIQCQFCRWTLSFCRSLAVLLLDCRPSCMLLLRLLLVCCVTPAVQPACARRAASRMQRRELMERRAGGGGPLMDVDAEMKAARHAHRSKQVGGLAAAGVVHAELWATPQQDDGLLWSHQHAHSVC